MARGSDSDCAWKREEAVYDPEDQFIALYAASGTNYEVSRIVRANAIP